MAYMAPQVVGKKGYSWQIDWWSLGITAYELMFHRRPFDGRSAEKMTQSIMKDPLRFPDDASQRCSEVGMIALKGVSHFSVFHAYGTDSLQFIDRDPTTRLGCRPNGQGIEDIRRHPWFSCIEWDIIEKKELQPPFIPDVCFFCAFLTKSGTDKPFLTEDTSELRRIARNWRIFDGWETPNAL